MSFYDDLKKGGLTTLALGVGVVSLLPAVLPVVARGVRPLLRSAVRGGIVCLEKGQEAVSEIRGILEDAAAGSGPDTRGRDAYPGMGTGAASAMAAETAAARRADETPTPAAYASTGGTPAGTVTSAGGAPAATPPRSEPLTRPTGEPDPEVLG